MTRDKILLMYKKDDVLFYYRNKAGFEEQLSEPFQQKILKDWFRYLLKHNQIKEWSVLDFGSGLGNNLLTMKSFFKNVVVTDVNASALKFSKKKYGNNINYVLLKNEKLPFKDKNFELVLATEVFEHLSNQRQVMKEIERVLKDKGFFILSIPNYFNLTGLIKKLKDFRKIRPMWGPWGGHDGGLEVFTTCYSIEKLLREFNVISRRGGDYFKAWFYGNPIVPTRFRKFILLWPGKLPLFKRLGMNYFILAQKK